MTRTPTGRRTNPRPRRVVRGRTPPDQRGGPMRGPSASRARSASSSSPRPSSRLRSSSRWARCSRYSTVFLCAWSRSAARRALPPSASQASSVSRSRAVPSSGAASGPSVRSTKRPSRSLSPLSSDDRLDLLVAHDARAAPQLGHAARLGRLGVAGPEALETVRRRAEGDALAGPQLQRGPDRGDVRLALGPDPGPERRVRRRQRQRPGRARRLGDRRRARLEPVVGDGVAALPQDDREDPAVEVVAERARRVGGVGHVPRQQLLDDLGAAGERAAHPAHALAVDLAHQLGDQEVGAREHPVGGAFERGGQRRPGGDARGELLHPGAPELVLRDEVGMDEVAGVDAAAHEHPGEAERVGRHAGVERELGVAEHREHVGQVRLGAALQREPQVGLGPERRERRQHGGVDARRERAETVAEVARDGGQDALGSRIGVGDHLGHGTTVLRSRPCHHRRRPARHAAAGARYRRAASPRPDPTAPPPMTPARTLLAGAALALLLALSACGGGERRRAPRPARGRALLVVVLRRPALGRLRQPRGDRLHRDRRALARRGLRHRHAASGGWTRSSPRSSATTTTTRA